MDNSERSEIKINTVDLIAKLGGAPYLNKSERSIWLQIYDRILGSINDGALPPHSKLPGELDVANLFHVSRVTVRRALSKLQQEGYLQARKGVGIFVRQQELRYAVQSKMHFFDGLGETHDEIQTKTLSLRYKSVSLAGAEALNIPIGSKVIELTRIRLANSAAIYLATKEFPEKRFPDFEKHYYQKHSVTDVYNAHGIGEYHRAQTRISGSFANQLDAEALKLTHETPLLRMMSVNCDTDEVPIEYNVGRWPLTSVELIF